MRSSQKKAKRVHCDVRLDIPLHLFEGSSSVPRASNDVAPSTTMAAERRDFSTLVCSSSVEEAVRSNLHLLFGVSAPRVETICADAARRSVSLWVSGGSGGVQMLRAACALVTEIQSSSGGIVSIRATVACVNR
jgi:hypothetical protein